MKELIQLKRSIKKALSAAKKFGATSADVSSAIEDGFNVIVREGSIETLEYHRGRSLGITVYFGKRLASATTTDIHPEKIEAVVRSACERAKFTEEDPCAGLAEPELMASELPDLDLYHPWEMTPETAIQEAIACEQRAKRFDPRIVNSEGVSVTSGKQFSVYGNTHGFIGAVPSTLHSISCSLIAEQNGQMERDYSYAVARDSAGLIGGFDRIADQAAERTIQRLGSRKLSTQKVPVLFVSEVARGLWYHLLSAISGEQLYRHSTFLVDHLEKPIFPSFIQVHEDPFLPKRLGSAAFDNEGVATRKQHFIKDGILRHYLLNSYTARKLGMQTTANAGGAHNLFVSHQGLGLQELIKKMNKGLLVVELIGQGVKLVTGDYSRGAVGFWVDHGEIQFPVSEITIAGNLKDMFANMVAVGKDRDPYDAVQTGSVLIEEMMIAGV